MLQADIATMKCNNEILMLSFNVAWNIRCHIKDLNLFKFAELLDTYGKKYTNKNRSILTDKRFLSSLAERK